MENRFLILILWIIKSLTFINSDSLIKSIVNYSTNKLKKPKPIEIIADKYNEVKDNAPYDRLQLCNGHDVTFITQLALKRKLGNYNAHQLFPKKDRIRSNFCI